MRFCLIIYADSFGNGMWRDYRRNFFSFDVFGKEKNKQGYVR